MSEENEDMTSREDALKATLASLWAVQPQDQSVEETGAEMVSPTTTADAQQAPEGSEASPRDEVQPEGDEEGDRRVPYSRFSQVNQEKNTYKTAAEEARTEATRLKEEIAELRKKQRDHDLEDFLSEENLPTGFEDWSFAKQQAFIQEKVLSDMRLEMTTRLDSIDKRLAAPTEVAERIRISEDVGRSLTAEQFTEIKAISSGNPGLTPRQLMLLARDKNPELFQGAGAGRPPASTKVTPPRPSGVGLGGNSNPEQKSVTEMLDAARTTEEREEAGKAFFSQFLQ
jgi:hypothetical protein